MLDKSGLIRTLEVGDQFLMRQEQLHDTSIEMRTARGKWLTVSKVFKNNNVSEYCYEVAEFSDPWLWMPSNQMDIEATNDWLQKKYNTKKKLPARLPIL